VPDEEAMRRLYTSGMAFIKVTLLGGWCLAALVSAGCMRSRAVEKDLRIVDVRTGWYDVGVVDGRNKLVPSITLKLQNVSNEPIRSVQLNAIFRRVGEQEAWGEHFVRAIGSDPLAPGATGDPLVLRSRLGYTSEESRLKMLQNPQFVDAKVEIYGKHGSRTWVKMGEWVIDRQLLAE
jgi:hypothetical protein